MSDSKMADSLVGRSWEAYMDATDFLHEEGEPCDGNKVFANILNLRKSGTHGCGIVKVKVELVEWIELPSDPPLKFRDQLIAEWPSGSTHIHITTPGGKLGDVFAGNVFHFRDCFFANATWENVTNWAAQKGCEVTFYFSFE